MVTSKQILKHIGCSNLTLYKGPGYWYFEYSFKSEDVDVFETMSTYVYRLGELGLGEWIMEGKTLVARGETKVKALQEQREML